MRVLFAGVLVTAASAVPLHHLSEAAAAQPVTHAVRRGPARLAEFKMERGLHEEGGHPHGGPGGHDQPHHPPPKNAEGGHPEKEEEPEAPGPMTFKGAVDSIIQQLQEKKNDAETEEPTEAPGPVTLKSAVGSMIKKFQDDAKKNAEDETEATELATSEEEVESTVTVEDWEAAVERSKTMCIADFDSLCSDVETSENQAHGHHGHGHGHGGHHLRRLLHAGSGPHRHPHGDHGHGHGPHGDEEDEEEFGAEEGEKKGCGGPLGFGSREADMCLKSQRDALSEDCAAAILETETMYRELKAQGLMPSMHGMHGHAHFALLPLFLMLLGCCLCRRRCRRNSRYFPRLIAAVADKPDLKAAIEDAAGTPLPDPDWKGKVRAAVEANPALKEAVEAAMGAGPFQGGHGRGPKKCKNGCRHEHPGARCGRIFMGVLSSFLLVAIAVNAIYLICASSSGQEEAGDEATSNPLVGFFFSVTMGFMLILLLTCLCKCCKALRRFCCPTSDSNRYPGEYVPAPTEDQQELTVFSGVPVAPPTDSTVPPLEAI